MSAWIREPTRVIHWLISAATIVAAVSGDLVDALSGTETWIGIVLALANVIQGEVNRSQVRPVKTSAPIVSDPSLTE